MGMEEVKKVLERGEENAEAVGSLPMKFFERLVMKGLRVDLIETGRIVCSFTVPSRLLVCIPLFLFFYFAFPIHLLWTQFIHFNLTNS